MYPAEFAARHHLLRRDVVLAPLETLCVRAQLDARVLLSDGSEFCCQTVEISSAQLTMTAPTAVVCGLGVVAYLDVFGGLEGIITGRSGEAFVVTLQATSHKRAKIASQIEWLLKAQIAGGDNWRGHERIVPLETRYRLLVGNETEDVEVINVSRRGAALKAGFAPALDTQVILGTTRARTTRTFIRGFAVQFYRLLPIETFGPAVIL